MSSRTPYLSVLVLLCAAFPAQLFRVGLAMTASQLAGGGRRARRGRLPAAIWLPVAFVVVAALLWYVAPATAVTRPPGHWLWCLVAVAAGLAALALEIGAGGLVARLRGRRVRGVRLHDGWSDRSGLALAGAAVVGVAEEVIFRGVALYLLVHDLAAPMLVALVLTAVVYGLNHLYFGWMSVLQKSLTGVLFGALFVASGYSLLVPVIAHLVQNLVVLTVLPRRSPASPATAPPPAPVSAAGAGADR